MDQKLNSVTCVAEYFLKRNSHLFSHSLSSPDFKPSTLELLHELWVIQLFARERLLSFLQELVKLREWQDPRHDLINNDTEGVDIAAFIISIIILTIQSSA